MNRRHRCAHMSGMCVQVRPTVQSKSNEISNDACNKIKCTRTQTHYDLNKCRLPDTAQRTQMVDSHFFLRPNTAQAEALVFYGRHDAMGLWTTGVRYCVHIWK